MSERLIKFTFFESPMGKPRMTQRDKWLNPPRPEIARWYLFKDSLAIAARHAGYYPEQQLTQLHITAYLPMSRSWSAAMKAARRGQPHTEKKPDYDNIEKAVADAICPEDHTIWKASIEKRWDDGQGARLEISLFVSSREVR